MHNTALISASPVQRSGALFSVRIEPHTVTDPVHLRAAYSAYENAYEAFLRLKQKNASTPILQEAMQHYQTLYQTFLNSYETQTTVEPAYPMGKAITGINQGIQTYLKQHFGNTLPAHLKGKPLIKGLHQAETTFEIKPSAKQERAAIITVATALGREASSPFNIFKAYKVKPSLGIDSLGEWASVAFRGTPFDRTPAKYSKGVPALHKAVQESIKPGPAGEQTIRQLFELDA